MVNDILSGILGNFPKFYDYPVFLFYLETSIIKGFRAAIVFDLGVILEICIYRYCISRE
jgi:hypothetical protein